MIRLLSFFILFLMAFSGCLVPAETTDTNESIEIVPETVQNDSEETIQENNQTQIESSITVSAEEAPITAPNQELVESVLESYNENDSSSFDNVNLLLGTDVDDVLPLLESNESIVQWTALYVLSNIAYKADAEKQEEVKERLGPYLYGDEPSFRLMAAITLVTMEDKAGIPILIELLDDESYFMLSEPPALICQYSNYMLTRYTEKDFGFSCMPGHIDAEAREEWEIWWGENHEGLVWDEEKEKLVSA